MDITEYKELVRIIMFDGTELLSDKPLDTLQGVLNSGVKFVKVDGVVINTSDVKRVEPFIANDIKQAIMLEKDTNKKEVMQYWYDTRTKENKKTN